MAFATTCSACHKSLGFELVEEDVKGAAFGYHFIRCAGCGALVTIIEKAHVSAQLMEIKDILKQLATALKVPLMPYRH